MELDEQSRANTTISTSYELFKYTRLPFGINSAAAIFQSIIGDLVKDIPYTCTYLDDMLVTGRSDEEHLQTLSIFERLKDWGLKLRRDKCEFIHDSVCYLSYKLDKHGLHLLNDKTEPIANAAESTKDNKLQSFIK